MAQATPTPEELDAALPAQRAAHAGATAPAPLRHLARTSRTRLAGWLARLAGAVLAPHRLRVAAELLTICLWALLFTRPYLRYGKDSDEMRHLSRIHA
jgi:hypothetical protein